MNGTRAVTSLTPRFTHYSTSGELFLADNSENTASGKPTPHVVSTVLHAFNEVRRLPCQERKKVAIDVSVAGKEGRARRRVGVRNFLPGPLALRESAIPAGVLSAVRLLIGQAVACVSPAAGRPCLRCSCKGSKRVRVSFRARPYFRGI